MVAEEVIRIQNFRKTYGVIVAVDDISSEVYRGEIFGLLGPNGAGKTSTVESLEGLRQPEGGTLQILGIDPTRQPISSLPPGSHFLTIRKTIVST